MNHAKVSSTIADKASNEDEFPPTAKDEFWEGLLPSGLLSTPFDGQRVSPDCNRMEPPAAMSSLDFGFEGRLESLPTSIAAWKKKQ